MKVDRGLHNGSLPPVLAAVAIALFMFPTFLRGQLAVWHPSANPHDLSGQERLFSDYSKDFREMLKASPGEEFEMLNELDHVAATAEDRLNAANAMLEMFDNISCKSDRTKVKPILKKAVSYVFMVV